MSYQSLQKQQEALSALQHFLENFKEELLSTMERYKGHVNRLHESGLSNEVYQTYLGNYYSSDRSYIQSLINHINDVDIPYIRKNLGSTEANKATASGAASTGWDF